MSVSVQEAPFDLAREAAALAGGRHDIGGLASFMGVVRDRPEGGMIAMTLEYYPGMTERKLEQIEADARRRWDLIDSRIVHRVGRMAPGEPIVLVLTASSHRRDALEACAFLIDWLKTKAPFWKYEETTEGGSWVDARETDDAAAAAWSEG